jgi:ABC-type Zn2+ transport system substrate-binding protein/surface adhesin
MLHVMVSLICDTHKHTHTHTQHTHKHTHTNTHTQLHTHKHIRTIGVIKSPVNPNALFDNLVNFFLYQVQRIVFSAVRHARVV